MDKLQQSWNKNDLNRILVNQKRQKKPDRNGDRLKKTERIKQK